MQQKYSDQQKRARPYGRDPEIDVPRNIAKVRKQQPRDWEPQHHEPDERPFGHSKQNECHSSSPSHNAPFYRWDSTVENRVSVRAESRS
jgi:hypothetical protein